MARSQMTLAGVLFFAVSGCFATRADLNVLLGQQKELALRLSRMQDHLADLTLRVQELRTDVREVRGEMIEVDLAQKPLQKELALLKDRLAQVEQQDKIGNRLKRYSSERAKADLLALTTPFAMYTAAVSAYAAAETERAMALFEELQRKWPSDAYAVGARVKQGMIYAAQGMYIETIDTLLEVIEKYPRSSWAPEAYLVLGTTLIQIEQTPTGEQLLSDLQRLYPASAEAAVAIEWLQQRQARLAALAATAASQWTATVEHLANTLATTGIAPALAVTESSMAAATAAIAQ